MQNEFRSSQTGQITANRLLTVELDLKCIHDKLDKPLGPKLHIGKGSISAAQLKKLWDILNLGDNKRSFGFAPGRNIRLVSPLVYFKI